MKKVSLIAVLIWLLLFCVAIYPTKRWTVEATANGKWRSCLETREWYEPWGKKGCGSATSYDEALWWSETHGGKYLSR